MLADGAGAVAQDGGDFFVCLTLTEPVVDLRLPLGEGEEELFNGDAGGHLRANGEGARACGSIEGVTVAGRDLQKNIKNVRGMWDRRTAAGRRACQSGEGC